MLCEFGKTKSPQSRQPKIELQLSSKPIPSTVKAKGFEMMKFLSILSTVFCLSLLLSCLSQGAVPAACDAQLPTEGLQPREWPVLGQGEGRGRRSSSVGLWLVPQPHPQGERQCFQFIFPFRKFGAAITGKPIYIFWMSYYFLCYSIQSLKKLKRGKISYLDTHSRGFVLLFLVFYWSNCNDLDCNDQWLV